MKILNRITEGIYAVLDDLLLLAGMAVLVYAAFQVCPPMGYSVLGGALIVLAYLVAAAQRQNGQ